MEIKYFVISFREESKPIAELLQREADGVYIKLLRELKIDPAEYRRQIFIQKLDDHFHGQASGNHIFINDNSGKDELDSEHILNTLRHEIAHVIVTRLTQGLLREKRDILNAFVHVGIAELIENDWQKPSEFMLRSSAMTLAASKLELEEMIERADYFASWDYNLQYQFCHIFWYQFVDKNGIDGLVSFLKI